MNLTTASGCSYRLSGWWNYSRQSVVQYQVGKHFGIQCLAAQMLLYIGKFLPHPHTSLHACMHTPSTAWSCIIWLTHMDHHFVICHTSLREATHVFLGTPCILSFPNYDECLGTKRTLYHFRTVRAAAETAAVFSFTGQETAQLQPCPETADRAGCIPHGESYRGQSHIWPWHT